jgi:pyrroloquinoline quinone biosynthesis protein D
LVRNQVKPDLSIHRPVLARHARYRRDELRGQDQIVFPEGVLVLNETGAAVVRLCDGRTIEELVASVRSQFGDGDPSADVCAFLGRLAEKGLVRDAAES